MRAEPVTAQRPPLLIPSHWELGFQHMNLSGSGEDTHPEHSSGTWEKKNIKYLLNIHLPKTVQNNPKTLSPDSQEAYDIRKK